MVGISNVVFLAAKVSSSTANDAIRDILMSPRFEGAISTIHVLTEFIDQYFAIFISVVSFFIISAALLRNVIAGAYAAFPKFWDKIADAKTAMEGRQLNLGGTDVSWMMKILAFFIPNLKELSDFHDNTVEPKHYFIVAIPKMFAVVMIGVMIYNGYYRDITAVTAEFGSALIEKTLLNVDPVKIIDRVVAGAFSPDFASEKDASEIGNFTSDIAKASYKKVMSTYYDISDSGTKTKLANQIESLVYAFVNSNASYFDSEKYKISYEVYQVATMPDTTIVTGANSEELMSFVTSIDMASFNLGSTKAVGETWYLEIITRHEKIHEKLKSVGVMQDLVMAIKPQSTVASQLRVSTKFTASALSIGGKDYYLNGNVLTPVTATLGVDFNTPGTYQIGGSLFFTSNGKQNKIMKIVIDNSLTTSVKIYSESRPTQVITGFDQDFPETTTK